VKRFRVMRGDIDEIEENRGRDFVVEKVLFQNGGIAAGFHLREFGLNIVVVDFGIDVFMLIVIAVKGFEDRLPILRVFGRGDQTRPIAGADFEFFPILKLGFFRGIVADR